MTLVLASQSPTRRRMLKAAGIQHLALYPEIDEEVAKAKFRAEGFGAHDLALALAVAKAMSVSSRRPGDHVIGADQTLAFEDGTMLDKPNDSEELAAQLRALSGQTHSLFSAAALAFDGAVIWSNVEEVRLTMRPLSAGFIADYVKSEGRDLLGSVGGYRIEGKGVQLFEQIEGSQFAIQGLPLLALLDSLRETGLLPA